MARNTKTRSKERLLFNKGPSLSPLMRCRRALWLQRCRILVAEKREVKRHWASFSLSSVHHIRVSHTLWTAAPGWCTLPPIPRLEYFQVKGILSNSLSIKKKKMFNGGSDASLPGWGLIQSVSPLRLWFDSREKILFLSSNDSVSFHLIQYGSIQCIHSFSVGS